MLSAHALHGDTLVPTQSGNKAIKDIQVGDLVLSKDEATNQVSYQSVSHQYSKHYPQTVHLTIADQQGNTQTITTNQTHPFFAQTDNPIPPSKGYVYQGSIDGADWVDASNLKAGDKLLSQDGSWQAIQSVQISNTPFTTYHLTVNNSHTHFVSADNGKYGVWCIMTVIGHLMPAQINFGQKANWENILPNMVMSLVQNHQESMATWLWLLQPNQITVNW